MKKMKNLSDRYRYLVSFFTLPAVMILVLVSCTGKPEPYIILEVSGSDNITNYSKSSLFVNNITDSINPTPIAGSQGDLFLSGDNIFVFDDTSSKGSFELKTDDFVFYVNDMISSVTIPSKDEMIPWFDNMKDKDFSELQFIRFISEIPDIYLPYLAGLAEIKTDAGLYYSGDFKEMSGLFKIFKPKYIVGPSLNLNDWELLKGMINMELMLVSIEDSVLNVPLPALPSLKQIFLTGIESDVILTNEFFVNNRQIEKVFIEKPGSFDFALLKPLDNLKELVINEADSIINFILINNQKNLELLSVTGNNLVYDAALIRLPSLRWIAFSSKTGQDEFNSIIDAHPGLEIIEIIENDKIDNLQPLSKLNKLFGLTITDTVTDIASIKTLKKLKYLSLPDKFLSDILNKTDIQRSLPDTMIAANEGFCLGSGWLLLLIPLVLLIRYFAGMKKTSDKAR